MILTVELDLNKVKMNQHAKRGVVYFSSYCSNSTARPGPLKWSVQTTYLCVQCPMKPDASVIPI